MKERPILFSTSMVKAILEGRKTQTRRILKVQPPINDKPIMPLYQMEPEPKVTTVTFHEVIDGDMPHPSSISQHKSPFGKIGDHLWVRETWRKYDCDECPCYEYCNCPPHGTYLYYADCLDDESKWKPSIHMPRSACRLILEITNICVERLQDVSVEDAKAEGFDYSTHPSAIEMGYAIGAKTNFRFAWEEIYGQNAWNKNPWVWVIEFKVIQGGAV